MSVRFGSSVLASSILALFLFAVTLWPVSLVAQPVCSAPALAIPDNDGTGVSDTLNLTDSGTINDLNVGIDITHTWVGDIIISLEHVDSATTQVIFDRPGSPPGAGCSSNNIMATLDDEAADPVEDQCAPADPAIDGTFRPNNPLSVFDGLPVASDWTLNVSDNAGADLGTLNEWCLDWTLQVNLALETIEQSDPAAGGSEFTYTLQVTNIGEVDATNVVLSSSLSFGLNFVDATTTQGSVSFFDPSIIALLGTLAAGESATVEVIVSVNSVPPFPQPEQVVVNVNSPSSLPSEIFSRGADFNPTIDATGVTGDVVLGEDGDDEGGAGNVNDGCQALTNADDVNGNIVLLVESNPATCNHDTRVANAEAAGAIGVIFYVLNSDSPFMASGVGTPAIPTAVIGLRDGMEIRDLLESDESVNATIRFDFPSVWQIVNTASVSADQGEADTSDNLQIVYTTFTPDADSDGSPDTLDQCQSDSSKSEPGVCGCGVPDTDSDGDGTADCVDQCSSDSSKTEPGICGCGTSDADTDGDGTADCNDQCSSDASKTEPGTCGCGVSDVDTDGDGTADCNDQCPSDASKTAPGVCGCGTSDVDSNSNGVLDCLSNQDLGTQLQSIRADVTKLRKKRGRRARKTNVLNLLEGVLAFIANSGQSIVLVNETQTINELSSGVERGVRQATKRPKNKKKRRRALRLLDRLLSALGL